MYAQNYRTFPRNHTALYQKVNNDQAKRNFYPLKADSQKIVGQDTVVYPMRVVNPEPDLPGNCTHNPFDTSWIGPKVLLKNNSNKETIFYSKAGKSISIYRLWPENSPWKFAQINDTTNALAVIDSLDSGNLTFRYPQKTKNGILYFNTNFMRLFVVDTNDNTRPHPLNNQKIFNSYWHGMWKTMNFHNFPNDTSTLNFFGFEKTSGEPEDTIIDQFNIFHPNDYLNYSIGQEFHYKITSRDSNSSYYEKKKKYVKQVIIDKQVYGDVDSIRYRYFYSAFSKKNTGKGWQDSSVNIDTISKTFVLEKYQFLDFLTGEFYNQTGPDKTTGYVESFTNQKFNGRFQHKFHSYFNYDSINRCLSPDQYEVPVYKYADNLGLVYYKNKWQDTALHHRKKEMIYYKKGLETWGEPFNFNKVVSVANQPDGSQSIRVYPNPVQSKLSIDISKFGKYIAPLHIKMSDLTGRIRWSKSINNNTENTITISFDQYEAGMYFLQISSSDASTTYTRKIIKK